MLFTIHKNQPAHDKHISHFPTLRNFYACGLLADSSLSRLKHQAVRLPLRKSRNLLPMFPEPLHEANEFWWASKASKSTMSMQSLNHFVHLCWNSICNKVIFQVQQKKPRLLDWAHYNINGSCGGQNSSQRQGEREEEERALCPLSENT